MSAARGERWGVGRQARRRSRLLGSLSGTIPWSELEHIGAQGGRRAARSPHAHPPPEGAGPVIPPLVRQWPDATTAEPRVAAWEQRLRALPRRVRRALQRHFVLSLAELALILALWQGPAWTATIPVDGTTCTLAAAITAANTDTATGGCPAGSGADILVLPVGGTITLTAVDNTYDGPTGLPVVSSTITIAGQGSTLQRDAGAPAFRLLAVGLGGDLTVQALTLQGGNAAGYGGGLLNRDGTVTIVNSTLPGNTAAGDGGGVSNIAGSVTIVNSTLSGNSSSIGGRVFNDSTLTMSQSTLSGKTSNGTGGVSNSFGSLTIANSTLSGNTADDCGGGAYNSGTFTLANSTLSGNTASCSGGGAYNAGTLTLTNSTLSDNTAEFTGGGIYNRNALTLTNSTLSGNSAGAGGGVYNYYGSLTLVRTLVSGNTAASGAEIYDYEGQGIINVDNFNLFGHDGADGVEGFAPGGSDIVPSKSLAAILQPLAFNGGPTQTRNLASDSPAADAILGPGCPVSDQRGFVRPAGEGCDIGAVEASANPPPGVTSPVDFVALPDTFGTTTDTTGCPGGSVGKFFFQAQLTNEDGGLSLEALKAQVAELTNGNLLQTADEVPGGAGALQTLPQLGAYTDGVLEPAGTVPVPFVICLQSVVPFRFTVDLLGVELAPPP